jgi:hypothetical protein
MALQHSIPFYIGNFYTLADPTSTCESPDSSKIEENLLRWGEPDMSDSASETEEMSPVPERFIKPTQPPQGSTDALKPVFAEVGGQEKHLPPTVTRDLQDTAGDIIPEPVQVDDEEQSRNPAGDTALGSPKVKDGEEPRDPARDSALEPVQVEDEESRNPAGDTALGSPQVKDGEGTQDPARDTERRGDSDVEERCQIKV